MTVEFSVPRDVILASDIRRMFLKELLRSEYIQVTHIPHPDHPEDATEALIIHDDVCISENPLLSYTTLAETVEYLICANNLSFVMECNPGKAELWTGGVYEMRDKLELPANTEDREALAKEYGFDSFEAIPVERFTRSWRSPNPVASLGDADMIHYMLQGFLVLLNRYVEEGVS